MATSARLLQRIALLSLAAALFVTVSSAADEPRYEHGISFFHELKYPADFTHFDYINPDAPKGGVLVLSTQRDFNTLTMFTDFVPAPATVRLMYDSLVSFRTQEMGSFYGRLADGLSVSDDKRTLFIRLHPEARWHIADGVLVNSAGEPFEIEFLLANLAHQRTLLPYLGTLKRLGITGKIRLVDGTQFVSLNRKFDYDARITQSYLVSPPIVALSHYFHSQSASQVLGRSGNIAGIADPVVDALIADAIKVTTLEEMATACRALDRVLLWGFYQIPLDSIAPFRIVYWNKFGRPEREDLAVYGSAFPAGWWYDDTKAARIEISQ